MVNSTRDRLLEGAWTCIRRGGQAAASSRAITAQAGTNLGAITYHFGSKNQLVAETLVAAIRRLVEPALDALREAGDPTSRVLQAIGRLQERLAESVEDAPAYLELLVQSRRLPSVRDQVSELFSDLRSALAAQIAEQQAEGFLPAWVEPEPIAALLLAVALGVVLETTVDTTGPPPAAIADQFAHLLVASR